MNTTFNGGILRTSSLDNLTEINYGGNNYRGPFAYNFVKITTNYHDIPLTYGNIKSIVVGNTEVSQVLVYDENGNLKLINVSEIEPEQQFYIPADYFINNYMKVTQNAKIYNARICFLTSGSWQKLIKVAGTANEISLTENVCLYDLKIVKEGEQGRKLAGAKFSIVFDTYIDVNNNEWPQAVPEEIEEFTTDENGEINKQFAFSQAGTYIYKIKETQAPNGYIPMKKK